MISRSVFSSSATENTSTYRNYSRQILENSNNVSVVTSSGNDDLCLVEFKKSFYYVLNNINVRYTSNMANNNFLSISKDYNTYLNIYKELMNVKKKLDYNECNRFLILLYTIIQQSLSSSLNFRLLNSKIIESTVKIIQLQEEIAGLLAGKHNKIALSNARGLFGMGQKFKLKPLYSFYIKIYGFPEQGVGFDPEKLVLLRDILDNNGISTK
jgi:hypothetical protein